MFMREPRYSHIVEDLKVRLRDLQVKYKDEVGK